MLIYDRKNKKDLREVPAYSPEEIMPTKIAFNSVNKHIPNWVSSLVEADNKSFILDS